MDETFTRAFSPAFAPMFVPTVAAAQARIAAVAKRHALDVQHKFVYELGWRAYFRQVWQHRGDGILQSLHEGPLPDAGYAREMPADIRRACTGVPVVDQAVRTLFNAAPMAPASWHSPDTLIDTSYEALDRMARQSALQRRPGEPRVLACSPSLVEPCLAADPPDVLGLTAPDAAAVTGRDVWLVHPWSLGELPASLPAGTQVIGVFVADFHRVWPLNERRCDSFSQWWNRATPGLNSSTDLLAVNEVPAW